MTDLPPVLRKARARLVVRAPFFGSLALRLAWREDAAVATMATDGRTILFNAAWCRRIGVRQTMAVIAHEVLHVAARHHLRLAGRDPRLWNIATDLVINTILAAAGYELPEGALLDREGRFAGLPAETVYARLWQERQAQEQEAVAPGTVEDLDSSGHAGSSEPAWGQVLEPRDESGRQLSPSQQARAAAEIEVMLRQAMAAARRAGKLPGGIQELIEAAPGRIDWRDRLRHLSDDWSRDGLTWARPNRRHLPHGLYLPAPERIGIGRIAAVLDTSGSIPAEDLAAYLGEMRALLEEAMPEELILLQCDTAVRRVEQLRPGDDLARIAIEGRGGTLFQPAFDWILEHAPSTRAIVYLTDLDCADRPQDPGLPVVWLSPCRHRAMPFGEIVHLAPD